MREFDERDNLEKEIYEKIKEMGEEVEIPESLSPKNIEKMLSQDSPKKKKPVRYFAQVIAACLVLFVGVGVWNGISTIAKNNDLISEIENSNNEESGHIDEIDYSEKHSLDGSYVVAKDYDDITKRLEEKYKEMKKDEILEGITDFLGVGNINEVVEEMVQENESFDSASDSVSSENDFSTTNVQTEGINEGDSVITDGEYIYRIDGSKIYIFSTLNELEVVSVIESDIPEEISYCEIYVDGNNLFIVAFRFSTIMECIDGPVQEDVAYYGMEENHEVIIYKYDISNIKNPVLVDEVHQEGNYNTTRKVGNIMYIFTNMFISYEKGVTAETVLPEINGELVDAKDVYICEDMRQEFITSSINLGETDEKMEVIDSMVIMNSYAEVYMGLDGLYLYESNYNFNTNVTNTIISKFGYKGGYMTAINCTTINGTIRDKFAINEKDENLRVLLTETKGGERSNKLVIYDAGLNYVSEIDGIAENEEIYAARYIGDIAYFITYRNTDPLFAVDVSDITNPKMLGYLEITGFSEYIHPYGEGKLLGIGYETDPDTGTFIGVKLVMFDISNPSEMKILGTKVLEGYDDVSVFYEYKDITISPEKNIIGIDTCEYMDYTCNHIVYKWTENGFEEIINKETDDIWFTRSVYIEDDYYILENGKVSKYDLSNPNSYITLEYE